MMNKNSERLVVGVVALLVGLLLGWMVRGLATYNVGSEMATVYDDWRVVCPAAKTADAACAMASAIIDPGAKTPIANVSITKDNKQQPMLGFTLPLDVALEPGIGLQVGKDPMRTYKYRTCNPDGCIVVGPIDDKLIDDLVAAGPNDVKLFAVGAGGDGKAVALPVSLKGFSVARRAYLSSEARRHSWFWRLWS
jgi:invasion protein IalB